MSKVAKINIEVNVPMSFKLLKRINILLPHCRFGRAVFFILTCEALLLLFDALCLELTFGERFLAKFVASFVRSIWS